MKILRLKSLIVVAMCLFLSGHAIAAHLGTDYTLGPQVVLGFPTTGIYDASESVVVAGKIATTTTAPLVPGVQHNPTANWTAVVTAAFPALPGWAFANSAKELTAGSLEVRTYDAVSNGSQVAGVRSVGVDFRVNYTPGVGDPTALTNDIHWIQVITNNHKLGGGGGHGINDNKVDNGGAANPYYDTLGAADASDFLDKPGRDDPLANHNWSAELFLVTTPLASGGGAQAVTVWSGVNWGWSSVVPIPGSVWLFGSGLIGLIGIAKKRKRV